MQVSTDIPAGIRGEHQTLAEKAREAASTADDFHDGDATREGDLLLVRQGLHQQALQGRQGLVARLVQQITDVVAIAR